MTTIARRFKTPLPSLLTSIMDGPLNGVLNIMKQLLLLIVATDYKFRTNIETEAGRMVGCPPPSRSARVKQDTVRYIYVTRNDLIYLLKRRAAPIARNIFVIPH